jgi:hypothetical protein
MPVYETDEVAPNPVESPPLAPTQIHSKVGGAAIGGAIAIIGVWVATLFGADMPIEVGIAIGTLSSVAVGYIAKS